MSVESINKKASQFRALYTEMRTLLDELMGIVSSLEDFVKNCRPVVGKIIEPEVKMFGALNTFNQRNYGRQMSDLLESLQGDLREYYKDKRAQ